MTEIYFYEWSDFNNQPKTFKSKETFLDFCVNSNITINTRIINYVYENNNIYAICKLGKNELVLSGDYKNLRKNFSKHKNH
jgi:hypothetical protein